MKASRHCRYCLQPIVAGAKVCQHCQRAQRLWIPQIADLISLVVAVMTIGLFVVGYFQYQAARTDRNEAAKALAESSRALALAGSLADENRRLVASQQAMQAQIAKSFGELFTDICMGLGGSFEFGSYSCVLRNGARIHLQVPAPP